MKNFLGEKQPSLDERIRRLEEKVKRWEGGNEIIEEHEAKREHSTRPWSNSDPVYLKDSKGRIICAFDGDIANPKDQSLILAAPDLLAACEQIISLHNDDVHGFIYGLRWDQIVEQAKKAIAKAKGIKA